MDLTGKLWPWTLFNTNLECQCKQGKGVQGRKTNLSSNVGFQEGLVKNVCIWMAIACMNYNTDYCPALHKATLAAGRVTVNFWLSTGSPLLGPCFSVYLRFLGGRSSISNVPINYESLSIVEGQWQQQTFIVCLTCNSHDSRNFTCTISFNPSVAMKYAPY
jgi:hypothetical protein